MLPVDLVPYNWPIEEFRMAWWHRFVVRVLCRNVLATWSEVWGEGFVGCVRLMTSYPYGWKACSTGHTSMFFE